MDLNKYMQDGKLKIKVIPHSGRTELTEEQGKLRLYLKAVPEKNKANLELVKSAFSTSIFTGGESVISPRLEKAGSEKTALSEANMQLVY